MRKDLFEKIISESKIDDRVETRQLILDIEANLPISVRFSERGLYSLACEGINLVDEQGIHQVESVSYAGDMGGILCSITAEEKKAEGGDNSLRGLITSITLRPLTMRLDLYRDNSLRGLITSITHLKVDPKHPLAERIKLYQKRRATRLEIANSGRTLKPIKSKKNKKGFGA